MDVIAKFAETLFPLLTIVTIVHLTWILISSGNKKNFWLSYKSTLILLALTISASAIFLLNR